VGTATIGVAIDIPEPWGSELTRRRAEAGDPAAANVPAHLTLLGPTEIDPSRYEEIEVHLSSVAAVHQPYQLQLRGTGTFRPITDVVFVAVAAGISECELLAASVSDSTALRRELRFPYHPHVTVAQDVPAAAMDAVFDDLAEFTAKFTVDSFRLFVHGPDGRWHPRREFRLGSG
jgi:2'-5' RNA ligase